MTARGLDYIVCCPRGCQAAPVACGAEDRPGDPGDGTYKLRAFLAMSPADRLALARALIADMPNMVVANVPEARPNNQYLTYDGGKTDGWNLFRTVILAQKEPPRDPYA